MVPGLLEVLEDASSVLLGDSQGDDIVTWKEQTAQPEPRSFPKFIHNSDISTAESGDPGLDVLSTAVGSKTEQC